METLKVITITIFAIGFSAMLLTASTPASGQVQQGVETREQQMQRMVALNKLLNKLDDDKLIQYDLELLDSQKATIKKIHERFVPLLISATNAKSDPLKKSLEWNQAVDASKEIIKEVNGVLLPHQKARYKEIRQLQDFGLFNSPTGFTRKTTTARLKLSKEQQEEIKKLIEKRDQNAARIREEVKEKSARIFDRTRDEALSTLTSEQKKRYRELFGADALSSNSKNNSKGKENDQK